MTTAITSAVAGLSPVGITEIINRYKMGQPGGHWFDAGTMKFFKTKLPDRGYIAAAGCIFFVTRETNPRGVTAYTVRVQRADGDIDTVGEFFAHPTELRAYRALAVLLKAHNRGEVVA